jgi:hypothetical protein
MMGHPIFRQTYILLFLPEMDRNGEYKNPENNNNNNKKKKKIINSNSSKEQQQQV